MYDQDIIEKKPSSPISTALLGVACFALIGGMVIMGMQIKSLKYKTHDAGKSGTAWTSDNTAKLSSQYKKLLASD